MLDETNPGQDTPGTPESSEPGAGNTSTPAASKDADKTKELNDRLSASGRELKSLKETVSLLTNERDAAVGASSTARREVDEVRQQVRELRRAGIKDDPGAIKLFQLEEELESGQRKLRDSMAELATKTADLTAREAIIGLSAYDVTITRLAKDHGITEKELTDTGIKDATQLENVARIIGNRGKPRATKPGDAAAVRGDESEPEPASVDGPGGTANPSVEQMDNMSMAEYVAARKKQDPTLTV